MGIIFYDFEVFKNDWLVCISDPQLQKIIPIVNDRDKLQKAYEYYKKDIWVGYNSRGYDQWVMKCILAGLDPYMLSKWIIEQDRKGWEFSKSLHNFPFINYDCSVGFRSLKELEGFMGHNIMESSVPFNINRKLTSSEIEEVIKYCTHDVAETMEVFLRSYEEFESHLGLIKEYDLPLINMGKTKAQLSAIILGAVKQKRDDEFDISVPNTLQLNQYEWIKDWYFNWAKNSKDYSEKLTTTIMGVEHIFAFGGLHGAIPNYIGDGCFLNCDFSSYYPAMMIEYGYLSRNVRNPAKFKQIRDERVVMKRNNDPRQQPRKIVLDITRVN